MCGHWFLAWKAEGFGLQANIPTKSIRPGFGVEKCCDTSESCERCTRSRMLSCVAALREAFMPHICLAYVLQRRPCKAGSILFPVPQTVGLDV